MMMLYRDDYKDDDTIDCGDCDNDKMRMMKRYENDKSWYIIKKSTKPNFLLLYFYLFQFSVALTAKIISRMFHLEF